MEAQRWLMLLVLVYLSCSVTGLRSEQELKKMRVKEIRTLLKSRGVACVGCVEKQEFVQRCLETEGLPEIPEAPLGDFCAVKTFNLFIVRPTIQVHAVTHDYHTSCVARALVSSRD